MKRAVIALPLSVLLLAACADAPRAAAPPTRTAVPTGTPAALMTDTPPSEAASEDLARYDTQGAVEFAVLPLGLYPGAETIEFEVGMNTHSVDLGWDLAAQSVLRTDTGLEVSGSSWPIGSGHHYGGVLVFPGVTPSGERVLEGARTLTLTIRDADVPERTFVWQLD